MLALNRVWVPIRVYPAREINLMDLPDAAAAHLLRAWERVGKGDLAAALQDMLTDLRLGDQLVDAAPEPWSAVAGLRIERLAYRELAELRRGEP